MKLNLKKFMLGIMAVSVVFLAACSTDEPPVDETTDCTTVVPDMTEAEQMITYTWEEFENLTAEQQMAFQNSFESIEAFDEWLQRVMPQEPQAAIDLPWESGGKQPAEYTWEEFEALAAEQQVLFQESFESLEAFDAWLQRVMPQETREEIDLPWESGGKQPAEYTWEEFENLTAEQQMVFQNSFESIEAFDAWMQKAQYAEISLPWENGGKQPEDYTWKEFENLSAELQMAFQNSFGSLDEFDKWLTANCPQ